MTTLIKIALLTFLLLAACTKSSVGSDVSTVQENKGFPTTLSSMDGWHGLHVLTSSIYGQPQCSAAFPKTFGQMSAELNLLNYLVLNQNAAHLASEGNCETINMIYAALDQLRFLATEKQNRDAARLLLYQGSPDMPFNLDGEVAEGYTESYLLPVLEQYRGLSAVLDPKQEDDIAKDVCGDLSWRQDVRDVKVKNRVDKLLTHLAATGSKRLAEKIINTCAPMHVTFPDAASRL